MDKASDRLTRNSSIGTMETILDNASDQPPSKPKRTLSRHGSSSTTSTTTTNGLSNTGSSMRGKVPFTRSRVFASVKKTPVRAISSSNSSYGGSSSKLLPHHRHHPNNNHTKVPILLHLLWMTLATAGGLLVWAYSTAMSDSSLLWQGTDMDVAVSSSHLELGRASDGSIVSAELLDRYEAHNRTSGMRSLTSAFLLSNNNGNNVEWPSSILTLHSANTVNVGSLSSCIVTAYFNVKSKYDSSKYDDWMSNMLSMKDCMVVFVEADMVETVLQFRGDAPTAVISMSIEDLPVSQYMYPTTPGGAQSTTATAFWEHQFDIDPEKKRHRSYQLFWIWLSKTWFVSTSAVLQKHMFPEADIQFWMWADIGSFRAEGYKDKQLIQRKEFVTDTNTVVWMAHHTPDPPSDPFWNNKLKKGEKQHFYHSGSHAVASSVSAWVEYHESFCLVLDEYAARQLFLGEDQCVLQTTCLLYPERCAYVPHNQVPDNHYFGLRHVLQHGPHDGTNTKLKPFQLWRPPVTSK